MTAKQSQAAKKRANLRPVVQFHFRPNPELSMKQFREQCHEMMIVHVTTRVDVLASLDYLHKSNPFKYWELVSNWGGMNVNVQKPDTPQLVINIPPLPQGNGPYPGVLSSPIEGQVDKGANLKLVVNATPIETIDTE